MGDLDDRGARDLDDDSRPSGTTAQRASRFGAYLGVEKAGIVEQLGAWFPETLAFPFSALGGYGSQTFVNEGPFVTWEARERPAEVPPIGV